MSKKKRKSQLTASPTSSVSTNKNGLQLSESSHSSREFDYPVFCFRHIHKDFHLNDCDQDEKKSLIERLALISQLSWEKIQLTGKHGLGTEKIRRDSIKAGIPTFVTDDVKHLYAFRFQGKKAMVGHLNRNGYVFHIIYLDRAFKLYNH